MANLSNVYNEGFKVNIIIHLVSERTVNLDKRQE
jgi:hypothetical protein